MFERLGTLTFVQYGWLLDSYSDWHIYLDGSRVLLKHSDFMETYICSEYDTHLNNIFITLLQTAIKELNHKRNINITFKQMISFHDTKVSKHTKDLQSFLSNILPNGELFLYDYVNDPNFIYKHENAYLISHSDYADFFL
tara:strand:+ start:106 stop:525 length:420 start_codon:yes stop_codon:yes gene_type:complete